MASHENPVVVITGASSGIGAATARLLADHGYRVILAARRIERLEALAEEIESTGGVAYPAETDVTDLEQVNHLVEVTLSTYGQIDILFNNAGLGRLNWLEELDPEGDIALQIQVNLLGMIQLSRAVLPHMIEREHGQIINMASMASFIGTPTYTIYAASKFGVRGFSEALRREVGVHGIQITVVYPGGVDNEFGQKAGINRRTGLSTPKFLKLTSFDVAREVLHVVKNPKRTVVIPRMMWLAVWTNSVFPGLVDWVISNRFTKQERTD